MRVLREIGRGGFGVVEEVEYNSFRYARKRFRVADDMKAEPFIVENARKRFIREIDVQSSMNHPNIVDVLVSDTSATPLII